MEKIRWGILSTGNIAAQFARGLASLPDAELVAVGSRSADSAQAFGETFQVPHRHATYEDLVNDPDVDVIYIGTPHPLHSENSLLCLRAGKPVLCEKPFTMNAREAEQVTGYARQKGIFLMEAMWTRFLPHIEQVRRLLAEGAIGEVRMVNASFCFRTSFNPAHRLFDPALGGGALLDVGIYPVSLASMILGAPAKIAGVAHLGETGVDEQFAVTFGYPSGQIALLSAAIRTNAPDEALILGTEGAIKLHDPWWKPTAITVTTSRGQEVVEPETIGNGYNYEAAEVMRCLRQGLTESPIMSLDETLSIMRMLDQIRAQWGLRYPADER